MAKDRYKGRNPNIISPDDLPDDEWDHLPEDSKGNKILHLPATGIPGRVATVEMFDADGNRAIVNATDAEEWEGRGYHVADAADRASAASDEAGKPKADLNSLPHMKPDWIPAFEEAGLDLKGVAASTVEELDKLPVKGLGEATAGKLIAEANEALKGD